MSGFIGDSVFSIRTVDEEANFSFEAVEKHYNLIKRQ